MTRPDAGDVTLAAELLDFAAVARGIAVAIGPVMRWMLVVALFGCDSAISPIVPDDAAVAPDAHVTAGTVTGTVSDRTDVAIAGATVCLIGAGTPQCTQSGSDGKYTLAVDLPDGESRVTGITTAPGFLGSEVAFVEDLTPQNGFGVVWVQSALGLFTTADATTLLATDAGFTYPTMTTGFVVIQVNGGPATATISASGAAAVYANGSDTPDPRLTAGDTALFGNLLPGTYDVTVQSPGRTCTVVASNGGGTINDEWPPANGGTLGVAVTANALTQAAVDCR